LDETPNAVVLRFVEKTPVEHLQELTLTTRFVNAISPGWHSRNVAIATAIAGCSGLANLKRLRLSHAGVGDEGGLALTQSEHLEGLQILDLTNCAFDSATEEGLRKRFGHRLLLGKPDFSRFTLGELAWH